MIENYKDLKFYIWADARMNRFYVRHGVKKFLRPYCIEKFLKTLRWTEYFANTCKGNMLKLMAYYIMIKKLDRISEKLGFNIPINTLGYGTWLAHYGSCTINAGISIGNYCAIMNNVCIADSNPKNIGNGVFFATGVVVAGKTNIADGCKISAMSFLNKSITVNKCLWGVPAKYLKDCDYWYKEENYHYQDYLACENRRNMMFGIKHKNQ